MSSKRRRKDPAQEISAGGVVVRGLDPTAEALVDGDADAAGEAEVVVIVPTRRAPDGSRVLALPKGHIDAGESALQAAEREVREETGIVAEPLGELGKARYWYRRDGRTISKAVSFYLFRHVGGDTRNHDDEVEEVRWIALKDAQTALTHTSEREMVVRALARLEEGGGKDR